MWKTVNKHNDEEDNVDDMDIDWRKGFNEHIQKREGGWMHGWGMDKEMNREAERTWEVHQGNTKDGKAKRLRRFVIY
jgi:hypothetical protein